MTLTQPLNRMNGSVFNNDSEVPASLTVGTFITVAGVQKEVVSSGGDDTINGNKLRNVAPGRKSVLDKAVNYTALISDDGVLIRATAVIAISLPDVSTLDSGWFIDVLASSGTSTVIPDGSDLIDGVATVNVVANQSARIITNGTAFYTQFSAEEAADGSVSVLAFGAVGDGATDDRAAIHAALNAGYSKVVFPAGRYYCATGFTIPGDTKMVGVSREDTEIFTDQDIQLVTIGGHRVDIEDMFINQTGAALTSVGIGGSDKYWVNTKNLRIEAFKYQWNFDKALYHTHINAMWENGTINCRYHATGTTWNTDWFNNNIVFINSRFNHATEAGFHFRGAGLHLIVPDASDCVVGFDIAGQAINQRAKDIVITSPYAELSDNPFKFKWADVNISGGYVQGGSIGSPYSSPLVAEESRIIIDNLNTGDYWTDYSTLTSNSTVSQREAYSAAGASENVDATSKSVDYVFEETGSFTMTLNGCTTFPTGTCRFVKTGNIVTLYLPSISGISNVITASLAGLPSNLYPSLNQRVYFRAVDGGALYDGSMLIQTGGLITLYRSVALTGFTASGLKGNGECVVQYMLNG